MINRLPIRPNEILKMPAYNMYASAIRVSSWARRIDDIVDLLSDKRLNERSFCFSIKTFKQLMSLQTRKQQQICHCKEKLSEKTERNIWFLSLEIDRPMTQWMMFLDRNTFEKDARRLYSCWSVAHPISSRCSLNSQVNVVPRHEF